MAAATIQRIKVKPQRAKKHHRCRLRQKKAEAKRRQGRPKQKHYYAKSRFSLKRLRKLLNNTEVIITVEMPDVPFSKAPERMYSFYRFQPLEIRLNTDGSLKGGILTFSFAWVELVFPPVADGPLLPVFDQGGYCWDPVTLFLLDLIRVLLRYNSRADLLEELHKGTALGQQSTKPSSR